MLVPCLCLRAFFFFFLLLARMILFVLQVPVSSARTWYVAMVSAQEYFMEFTSTQRVLFSYFDVPIYANICMYECMRHAM